ncbi:amyloid fiber anchoring/assembly protein TapA [Virgibacillus sp. 179-BFC.A HS]|uniref:Amyloid fiber anchoring/assembly protein TapA n=1 Tax=Tigheibacillus jepli TaxID=3035914 RepID=A0ABU5CH00_9BACI|nr:amyloid fiber anchoring/assembly protein TapA [Virgibacillus sp. 179-BFC.A HS]MDY0404815.1 amyloid fiber anchoring/assembly protein TapA [Virgibacillus sp. 179-BFC.A HS]
MQGKKRGLFLILKIMIVCYLIVFGISFMTSDTSAYLSSQSKVSGEITAGEWEVADESKLAFLDKGNQNLKACPANMKVTLKNIGKGPMLQTSTYEIYYVVNGNPKKHGTKVRLNQGEGTVKILEKGETVTLSYQTDKPGRYIFKVYQSGVHDEKTAVWSKEIKVNCKKETEKTKEDAKEKAEDDQAEKSEKPKQTDDQKDEKNDGKKIDETKTNTDANEEKEKTEDSQTSTSPKEQTNESADQSNVEEKPVENKPAETTTEEKPDAASKMVQKKVKTIQNKEGADNEKAEDNEVGK